MSKKAHIDVVFRQHLKHQVQYSSRRTVEEAEVRSWIASLTTLMRDLDDAGLEDVEIIPEYQIPFNDSRVDALLCGTHPRTGADSYIAVELKQWSSAEWSTVKPARLSVIGLRRPQLQPVEQLERYARYIKRHFREWEATRLHFASAVYLHNALDAKVMPVVDASTPAVPVFTGERRGEFLTFLRTHLSSGDAQKSADRLLGLTAKPPRSLVETAREVVLGQRQFVLLDEQLDAYRAVIAEVEAVRGSDRKSIVIIKGGAGSGKSAITLELLREFRRRRFDAVLTTGSRAYKMTLDRAVSRQQPGLDGLVKFNNEFTRTERNRYDVLLSDEAHRLRRRSTGTGVERDENDERTQLEELVDIANVPVFLLDEYQSIRPDEVGTVEYIRRYAQQRDIPVRQIDLRGYFRHGGCAAYDAWLRGLLGFDGVAAHRWEGPFGYQVESMESPQALEAAIRSHAANGETARIAAGFCWKWSKPVLDDEGHEVGLVDDVVIGNWRRPWNSGHTARIGSIPPSEYWATSPGGIGQIGCVYTAQGLEYDWAGVILGPDVTVTDAGLTVVRSASADSRLLDAEVSEEHASQLIRNAYGVLLSRGLKGTLIYACRPEVRDFLADPFG